MSLQLQLIVVIEQLGIQATWMGIDTLQKELLCKIVHGVELRLAMASMLKAAAGRDDVVKQRRRKVATISELLDANVTLALAQLTAIRVDQQRQMTKLWWLPVKGPKEANLNRNTESYRVRISLVEQ